jgi:hypothetical protein
MMKCVKCGSEIRCKLSIKTEEDDRPIEISYQWWSCETCGAKYYGILEDSHVNMFDDRLRHQGYLAEETKWQESLKWGLKCPDSSNAHYKCEVHENITPGGFTGDSAWYTYD